MAGEAGVPVELAIFVLIGTVLNKRSILHQGDGMTHILHLQTLSCGVGTIGFDGVLMSTASGICPSNLETGEANGPFEME